jgi:hypothetical protein
MIGDFASGAGTERDRHRHRHRDRHRHRHRGRGRIITDRRHRHRHRHRDRDRDRVETTIAIHIILGNKPIMQDSHAIVVSHLSTIRLSPVPLWFVLRQIRKWLPGIFVCCWQKITFSLFCCCLRAACCCVCVRGCGRRRLLLVAGVCVGCVLCQINSN